MPFHSIPLRPSPCSNLTLASRTDRDPGQKRCATCIRLLSPGKTMEDVCIRYPLRYNGLKGIMLSFTLERPDVYRKPLMGQDRSTGSYGPAPLGKVKQAGSSKSRIRHLKLTMIDVNSSTNFVQSAVRVPTPYFSLYWS
jgi:hypothetical protein